MLIKEIEHKKQKNDCDHVEYIKILKLQIEQYQDQLKNRNMLEN